MKRAWITTVWVRAASGRYPVWIGSGLLRDAGRRLRRLRPRCRRLFVVSSPRIWRLWGGELQRGTRAAGLRVETLLMNDREANKRLATVERLAGELVARGAHPPTPLSPRQLHAGGGLCADPDDARRPGGQRPGGQARGQPGRWQEPARGFPSAGGGGGRPARARELAGPRVPRRALRSGQRRGGRRRDAFPVPREAPAGGAGAQPGGAARYPAAVDRAEGAHRVARRARAGAAAPAELRPHSRARPGNAW